MATTTNIHALLKYYATRQNNATVNVFDFCEYMRRYAQHHVEEQADLVSYLTNSHELVRKELEKLAAENQVVLIDSIPEKQEVIVIGFFIDKFVERYQDMKSNPSLPYPSHTYLPKNTPSVVYKTEPADLFFNDNLAKQDMSKKMLYCLKLPRQLPTILFPSTVPISNMLEISLLKLQIKLSKEEYHDYFLKKLKIANPGKELTVKNFFTAVTKKPELALNSIRDSAESFYQWNQLCFFVKQDFENLKDITQEDIALLQSICIIEYCASFYRNKAQQDLQRSTALRNLELVLNKPPYYFSKEAIKMFSDSRGIPLLGQYSESDLNDYLLKLTTESVDGKLPMLLTFKMPAGNRNFVSKTKVLPLIVRLCNDARETVREILTKECHVALKKFEAIPEFKNQDMFEKKLENIIKNISPALHSILNSGFIQAVYFEMRASRETTAEMLNLFHDGLIPPYSELLMISKEEILTDAKILLPIWYTMPVLSWFLSLFLGPPKPKKKPQPKKTAAVETSAKQQKKVVKEEKEEPVNYSEKRDPAVNRKTELKQAAQEAEKYYIPENSTLDRELASYEQIWNRIINPQTRQDLTEDVNALIRDYTRKITRSLKASNFTPDRIRNLAETLAKTPGLQRIKDKEELCMYMQLYMVKLLKNL